MPNLLLQSLLQLDENHSYTINELAAQLSQPVVNEPVPEEDSKLNIYKLIWNFVKSLLLVIITWLPVVISIVISALRLLRSHIYPVFNLKAFIIVLIALLPTCLMILLPKFKEHIPKLSVVKGILIFLCILSIPVCGIFSIGISSRSETTDIRNYRRFDPDCLANRALFFQELFPTWPHYFDYVEQPDGSWKDVYLDARYLYRNLPAFDYTYDIYAQWPLKEDEFKKEVARVKALFEGKDYTTVKKGNYTCFFLYDGDEPFKEVTRSYTYYIFAYDEQNLVVRYIMCDSLEDGYDQPYYLSLDW